MSKYRDPPTLEEVRTAIADAAHFVVAWKGAPSSVRTKTVAEGRSAAIGLTRADGQQGPVVYAVGATGKRVHVPDDFAA